MKKKSVYDKIKDEEEKVKEENKPKKNLDIKAMFSQRVLAFLMDLVLLSLITSLITMFVPVNDTATKLYEEQNRVLEGYVEGTVTMEEYVNQMVDLGYDISKQTVIASIVTIFSTVPFLSLVYPRKCFVLSITLPSWNFFLTLHLILFDMLRLSSSARLAIIVRTNSLRSCSVSRFSFSNMIPIPSAFSFLAVCTQSSVFLANRLTDFVIIRNQKSANFFTTKF